MNILNHSEFDSVTMKKFAKMSATPTKGWKIFRIFTISIIVLMALLVTVCVLIIPSLWVHGLIVYLTEHKNMQINIRSMITNTQDLQISSK